MPNLSPLFLDRLKEVFGTSVSAEIIKTFIDRPTTFRVNTLKARRDEVLEVLQQEGFKLKRVPWYGDAFILENKKLSELQKLSLYQDGKIYVQSLASMVPPLLMDVKPGDKVLDLTAAPGSKTTQIAAFMQNKGELVANDRDEIRFQRLAHNLKLMGVKEEITKLTQRNGWDLVDEYKNYFDKILLDAPCTAEARIILKQPRSFSFWNEKNIKEHAFIQRKLLFAAWEMLKPGGVIVYSTCTFAPEENEMQIDRLIKDLAGQAQLLPINISQLKSVPAILKWQGQKLSPEIKNTLRILPTVDVEGFFAAKISKKI